MKKKYVLISCFFFVYLFAFAQKQDETVNAHIKLRIDQKKAYISLRWAVDEPIAWQKSNKVGFRLKRHTLMRDGKLLTTTEEKELGAFSPAPQSEWMKVVEKNANAAIVAQSLFGESFEVEMGEKQAGLQGIINKSREIEQRFAYALMAADLDFEVAKLAGWGYTDTDVKANERYLYKVSINQEEGEKTAKKGSAITTLSVAVEQLPKPIDFIGIFKDRAVTLSWEYLQLRDTYTAYYIEKSVNANVFSPLGDLPVMNMNDSEGKQTRGLVFIDSLIDNQSKFSYRIRGKTIFGDFGPYSDIISGEGKKSLEGSPRIFNFDVTQDESVNIQWEFPKEMEKELVSFELLHSATDLLNSFKVVRAKIPITSREVKIKTTSPSNYYRIRAISKTGELRESFSVLVQPNDFTPPNTPIELIGSIDSLGTVSLRWKANAESDLEGYHVFRGEQEKEELVRITSQAITENHYEDKVVLENLNAKVYYYVTATDKRKNQSTPSLVVELQKPDKVKPQTPVFTTYQLLPDGKIVLHWLRSYSEDVVAHQLYRKGEDGVWEMIHETKDVASDYNYVDKNLEAEKRYTYYLLAVDGSNLKSDKSPEITLRSIKTESQAALSNLSGYVNRDKKQIELLWKLESKLISEIVVYRQNGLEKPSLWGTLQGGQNFLEDTAVKIGNSYTYLIKPLLKNNQLAKTEKITIAY